MIKTNAQLKAEIIALPTPITRSALVALLTNMVDSGVLQTSGITYGNKVVLKANGNTNIDTQQTGDGLIYINNEGVITQEIK
jgi:hypothetical protein